MVIINACNGHGLSNTAMTIDEAIEFIRTGLNPRRKRQLRGIPIGNALIGGKRILQLPIVDAGLPTEIRPKSYFEYYEKILQYVFAKGIIHKAQVLEFSTMGPPIEGQDYECYRRNILVYGRGQICDIDGRICPCIYEASAFRDPGKDMDPGDYLKLENLLDYKIRL